MSSPAWWTKAVIYELYVDKFANDFTGLTSKLDYFTDLGVDTLWILPHYPSPLVDDGYDISDFTGVRQELGTPEDFDHFIKEAHIRGLKVIIDLVLNHTSSEHSWFKESASSRDNPKRNWYLWNDNQDLYSQAFIHFSDIKKSNWIFNKPTGDYYYATFYPQQPDLNWDNPEVVSAMLGVMDFWLDKGIDGFRLDAISRLIKRDGTNCFALPENHLVLIKIRSHLDSKFPGTVLMAEAGGWPEEARPFFGEGDECQMVIHFPLAVRLLSAIGNRNLSAVKDIWQMSGGLPGDCRWAVFLTNHDSVDLFFLGEEEKRKLREKVDPHGIFITADGQSIGARLGEICQGNSEDIVWATSELLSQPGTPIIYYGNEIGMRNLVLPEKPKDIRAYVRGSFDWAEAERQKSDPNSILNQVRTLIRDRQINS
jgi:maltose alpha-D-glucosyltransferase / alpha-amylase